MGIGSDSGSGSDSDSSAGDSVCSEAHEEASNAGHISLGYAEASKEITVSWTNSEGVDSESIREWFLANGYEAHDLEHSDGGGQCVLKTPTDENPDLPTLQEILEMLVVFGCVIDPAENDSGENLFWLTVQNAFPSGEMKAFLTAEQFGNALLPVGAWDTAAPYLRLWAGFALGVLPAKAFPSKEMRQEVLLRDFQWLKTLDLEAQTLLWGTTVQWESVLEEAPEKAAIKALQGYYENALQHTAVPIWLTVRGAEYDADDNEIQAPQKSVEDTLEVLRAERDAQIEECSVQVKEAARVRHAQRVLEAEARKKKTFTTERLEDDLDGENNPWVLEFTIRNLSDSQREEVQSFLLDEKNGRVEMDSENDIDTWVFIRLGGDSAQKETFEGTQENLMHLLQTLSLWGFEPKQKDFISMHDALTLPEPGEMEEVFKALGIQDSLSLLGTQFIPKHFLCGIQPEWLLNNGRADFVTRKLEAALTARNAERYAADSTLVQDFYLFRAVMQYLSYLKAQGQSLPDGMKDKMTAFQKKVIQRACLYPGAAKNALKFYPQLSRENFFDVAVSEALFERIDTDFQALRSHLIEHRQRLHSTASAQSNGTLFAKARGVKEACANKAHAITVWLDSYPTFETVREPMLAMGKLHTIACMFEDEWFGMSNMQTCMEAYFESVEADMTQKAQNRFLVREWNMAKQDAPQSCMAQTLAF